MPTQEDLLLGQLAVSTGRLSPQDLARCLEEQAAHSPSPPLLAILLGRGFLGERDLEALLESHPALALPPGDDGTGPVRVADLERRLAGGGDRAPAVSAVACSGRKGIPPLRAACYTVILAAILALRQLSPEGDGGFLPTGSPPAPGPGAEADAAHMRDEARARAEARAREEARAQDEARARTQEEARARAAEEERRQRVAAEAEAQCRRAPAAAALAAVRAQVDSLLDGAPMGPVEVVGALRAALPAIDAAAALDPAWAEPAWYRGRMRLRLGDERGGLADLRQAATLEPKGPWRGDPLLIRNLVSAYARLLAPAPGGAWAQGDAALAPAGRAARRRLDLLGREIVAAVDVAAADGAPPWEPPWRRGVRALIEGKAAQAAGLLEQAAAAGGDGSVGRDLALARLVAGESESALVALGRASESTRRSEDLAALRRVQALAQWCRGELTRAVGEWDAALKLAGADAEGYSARGQLQALRGDVGAALADQAQAIATDPGLAAAYARRGLLLLGRGETAQAEAEFDRALACDPDEVSGWARLAEARRAAGDPAGALAVWDGVIRRAPRSAEAYASRAAARREAGDLPGAEQDLTAALAVLPGAADLLLERAQVRRGRGDAPGALVDARESARLRPWHVGGQLTVAALLVAQRDLDGAIEAYGHAIDLDPRSPTAYVERGVARVRNSDLRGAFADLSTAIDLAPGLALPYANRGQVRQVWGDLGGALKDFSKALELDPKLAVAYVHRGLVRRDLGDPQGALADTTAALEIEPTNLLALINRGELRRMQGDLDGALADFDAALALRANLPEALGGRGMILQRRGQFAEALRDFERFLQLVPDHALSEQIAEHVRQCKAELAVRQAGPGK